MRKTFVIVMWLWLTLAQHLFETRTLLCMQSTGAQIKRKHWSIQSRKFFSFEKKIDQILNVDIVSSRTKKNEDLLTQQTVRFMKNMHHSFDRVWAIEVKKKKTNLRVFNRYYAMKQNWTVKFLWIKNIQFFFIWNKWFFSNIVHSFGWKSVQPAQYSFWHWIKNSVVYGSLDVNHAIWCVGKKRQENPKLQLRKVHAEQAMMHRDPFVNHTYIFNPKLSYRAFTPRAKCWKAKNAILFRGIMNFFSSSSSFSTTFFSRASSVAYKCGIIFDKHDTCSATLCRCCAHEDTRNRKNHSNRRECKKKWITHYW